MKYSLLILVTLPLFLLTAGCSHAPDLPVYNTVPHFSLTDSYNRPFNSDTVRGKVWVADFIYTHCPGPCPRMTSQMHRISNEVAGKTDVYLVSFTVDPARDTPVVLNDFAQKFGGPSAQWSFLTGSPDTLHLLARKVFAVGDLVGVMDHSTKFILVDKTSRIRGYYSTFDPEGMRTLLHNIDSLRKEAA